MPNSATIVLRDLSTGAGRTGLTVKLRRKDDNFTTDYLTATEVTGKPGVYEFTDVPFNKYKLWVNGSEENSFGGSSGRWWPVDELTELPYLKLDGSTPMQGGLDMGNHRIWGVDDPGTDADVGDRGYNDSRYLRLDGSTQAVSGEKTFSNLIVDVGANEVTSAKLVVRSASNPPNGGVTGLRAGYQSNNRMLFDFMSSNVKLPAPTEPTDAVPKQYVDNNFVDKTTNQGVGGQKTFSNLIVDIGNATGRDILKTASNPANGGKVALRLSYQADNKPLVESVDGKWRINDLHISTSASKYIAGNPAQNDYVWRKWVQDNFQPIGSTYSPNTIIIDQKVNTNVFLRLYSSIQAALEDLLVESVPASNNRYTLLLKYPALTGKYSGSIELPDWLNIIGECQVIIDGSLTRAPSSETDITSIIQNIDFIQDATQLQFDIQRLEVVNCLFQGNLIDVESSALRQVGLFGATVQSSDNNKIVSCFGNQDVAWQSNDEVYSYNYNEGGSW